MKRPYLVLIAWSIFVSAISSAPITWDTATPVNNANDVSNVGTTVEAFNAGATGAATVTVNGVTFTGIDTLLLRNSSVDAFNGDTGDAGYNTLLSNVDFGNGGDLVTLSVGGNQLVSGNPYQIQVWFVDTRNNRVMRFGDGEGSASTVDLDDQFSIGTFVADSANQPLTLDAIDFSNAHITAYQIRALPLVTPSPEVPSNLTATAGDGEVSLDWDDNSQFGFSNFIVRRSTTTGGPYTDIASPTDSDFVDATVSNDTTYYYVVAAQNTTPEVSNNSNEASATPEIFIPDFPAIPSNVTIQAGSNRNTLQWDANTQEGFLEFRVFRSTVSAGPYTLLSSGTESRLSDGTASNGTTYYYVVTAVNVANEESPNSAEVSATPSSAAQPPNFVFIITDDQDTYSVNAYRETEPVEPTTAGLPYVVDTPNIDRLAEEGMLFHQARYMGSWTGAVCTGSRTCIMTGMGTFDSLEYRSTPNDPAFTLPGIFNTGFRTDAPDLPYITYRTCKNGNSYPTANAEFSTVNDATRRGNTDGNGSEWHGERALDQLEDWRVNHQPNGEPFMMYLGFSHPHDERNARDAANPPNLASRYGSFNTRAPETITSIDPASPPAPINLLTGTPETFPAHPFDNSALTIRDEITAPGILRFRTEEVVRNEIGRNFACVSWIDQQMGLVFAKLEDPNGDGDTSDSVMDNTYIVFTSDHGIAIGRHGLQGKQNLYEHTWKVPFIVRGPGIAAGSRTDALVYLHDTFPTFCDLAGIDLPPTLLDDNDGKSFRAVLEGSSETHRDYVYGTYSGSSKPGIRSVCDGRFKLIKYDAADNASQVTQLFDLQRNPFELLPEHGVSSIAERPAYAAIRSRLEAELIAMRVENNDTFAFLGDRTLLRFEDGEEGSSPTTHLDEFAFANDATAASGTGGSLPILSASVPATEDFVLGQPNTLSLDFEQDLEQHLEIEHSERAINFGNAPFTIEAWVKLETLPATNDLANTMPVAMKKVIGAGDNALDYMFLAAAGNYGDATTFNRLALHLGNEAIVSSLSIPDTEWHHISVALDPVSDTLRFTMDDQVDTQSETDIGITNTGPLVIGAHFNSSSNIDAAFDGLIDEFSITDGFLSLAELQPLAAVTTVEELQITDQEIDPANSTFNLTFQSDETQLYSLQRSATLLPQDWSDVDEFTFIPGTLSALLTTTPDLPLTEDTTREFFRVVVEE